MTLNGLTLMLVLFAVNFSMHLKVVIISAHFTTLRNTFSMNGVHLWLYSKYSGMDRHSLNRYKLTTVLIYYALTISAQMCEVCWVFFDFVKVRQFLAVEHMGKGMILFTFALLDAVDLRAISLLAVTLMSQCLHPILWMWE